MAMQQNAVGILFDVKGGGDISGASGKAIRASIASIVDSLGKDDATKIKFTIDIDEFKKQMSEMTESVTKTTDKLKKDIDKIISSTSGGGGGKKKSDGAKAGVDKNDIKAIKEYYQWLVKVEKAATRTKGIEIVWDDDGKKIEDFKPHSKEWEPLVKRIKEAKAAYDAVVDSADKFEGEQKEAFDAAKQTIETQHEISQNAAAASGAESWAKLSVNINKYIQDVEYAASRSPEMAEKLSKLKELADSGDMSNYDEARNMWREIQQEINAAGLSVETFGQKIAKHLGETLRNAVAAFISAKIGQYIKGIYDNVVKLDEAIVNLQIATGKNREEVTALVKEYSKLGRQLGATTKEIAAAADTWLRQGLSESDAEKMIKNTTMLSKLGQMESEEAAKALTSAMKGYNIAVEDTISIVDKWTAVDMEAAANAGDLATAMSETATSAGLAGVEMDTLIGYIATVKEVTQDGAESVGTFFRTLFARMNNVAAGNFVDQETGEALNDVEKVLGELGIKLRDVNGIFRESGDVLDEVASKWKTYDNVQRHAIATAFAGTRQQEKFIVLMENYGDAAKYAGIAADSAGIATEKFGAHTEGIQGKVAALTAAYEGLSMSILDSGLITGLVEMVTRLVDFMSVGDAVPAKIALCIAAVVALVGATQALTTAVVRFNTALNAPVTGLLRYSKTIWGVVFGQNAATIATDQNTKSLIKNYTTGLSGVLTFIPRLILAIPTYIALMISKRIATDKATEATIRLRMALLALNINPVMLAITALVALSATLIAVSKKVDKERQRANQSARDQVEQQNKLIESYDSEIDSLSSLQEKLEQAHGNRKKLVELYDELNSKVNVSSNLLKGEENAYLAASVAIQDRINQLKEMRKAALDARIASQSIVFDTNEVLYSKWNPAYDGEQMRLFARLYGIDGENFITGDTKEEKLANILGFDTVEGVKAWTEYWDGQVKIAKETFNDVINNSSGFFGDEPFLNTVVDRLVRSGYYLQDIKTVVDDLLDTDFLDEMISEYYEVATIDIGAASTLLRQIESYIDDYAEKYPEIAEQIIAIFSGISDPQDIYNGAAATNKVNPIDLSSLIQSLQDDKSLIEAALADMAETGIISPDTLAKIFDPEQENEFLQKYISQTEDGWVMAYDAFDQIVGQRRNQLVQEVEAQKAAAEGLNYIPKSLQQAILNLETYDKVYSSFVTKNIDEEKHPFVELLESIKGPYDALKDAVEDMSDDGVLDAETIAKILGDFPELQEYVEKQMDGTWTVVDGAMDKFIARLRAKIWVTGDKDQLTWFDSVIKTLGIDSENVQDEIDTYLEVYDDVAGPLKALQSAASEFNETGFVSHDTVADILDPDGGFPELAQYLEETADGYKYNVDAIERFLMSKREEYDAVILSNEVGSEAREAAKQNKRWLEMVIETIRRESGEYKSFADILDDVANKYSAVSSAIEDMEKYGKLSKGSLSSILNDEDLKAYLTLNKDGSYSFDVDAFDKWATTEEQRLRDLRDSYMEGTDAYIEADNKLQEHIAAVTAAKVSAQKEEEHPFVKMLNSIREPYELLVKATKEMKEGGLTPDTLAKIFVDFPELEEYIRRGEDGLYRVVEDGIDALQHWIENKRKKFTSDEDLALFDSIIKMLGLENAEEPEEVVDTFSEMLEYIRGPYDALKTAIDEMAEDGALTTGTIDKLLGDFPELEAYVERGADGLYRLVQGEADALQRWIEDKRKEFTSDEQRSLFDDIIRLLGLEGEEEPEFVNPLSAILEEVESSYDLLRSAKEDMEAYGVISESTLSSLASLAEEDYEALKNYFALTADGYTMCEDALEQYVEAKKKEYVAVLASAEVGSDAYNEAYKNLANLLAVFMTLSLSDQIEEATEALEDQTEVLKDQREVLEAEQDAWEDRRDAYRDIIDYRKDLLQTFKEELDYQRELEQRQRSVADLQTRLSVARLDRSAAGRAKVRELEDELASAEEDLNDFTLEHAIEQITSQMDREADEYNRFIDSKIAEIDSAIEDVETEIENVRTAIENVSRNIRAGTGNITAQINALLREYGITPPSPSPEVYHSGGFVGGVATLKSNEEFAKLMVGEHVSTPAQIQRFMNETLPGIASNSSRNEFNAPLISIECESVTTEALPGLKQIVNEAVREVKKQLDDGFSRTGYKKPVTRPI